MSKKKTPTLAMPPVTEYQQPAHKGIDFSDPKLQHMIDKGLDVYPSQPVTKPDKLKSFTFKIYESELEIIREIQARLPKRDRISIHDFVVDAVKDKIIKEQKRSNQI